MASSPPLPNIQQDLLDIQHAVNLLADQLDQPMQRRLAPHVAATLLAAISVKLDYVRQVLRN